MMELLKEIGFLLETLLSLLQFFLIPQTCLAHFLNRHQLIALLYIVCQVNRTHTPFADGLDDAIATLLQSHIGGQAPRAEICEALKQMPPSMCHSFCSLPLFSEQDNR